MQSIIVYTNKNKISKNNKYNHENIFKIINNNIFKVKFVNLFNINNVLNIKNNMNNINKFNI